MSINEIRAIEIFIKATELGSLRQAAKVLGISPQAASQSLNQLEAFLGIRLLNRTTRNLSLTSEGRQFLEGAQPAVLALERALNTAKNARDDISGPLRISGPHSTFLPVLTPLLNEFCEKYPDVQPDIYLNDRVGNWVEDQIDVGFRIGTTLEDGLIARKLFTLQLIICATPEYIAQYGRPKSINDLSNHRCSVFRHPATGKVTPWYLKIGNEVSTQELPPAFSTNSAELEVEAVLSGQFIGQLSNISAVEHIRSGRLIPLLTKHMADQLGLFIYYGSRNAQSARVRAFIDLAISRLTNSTDYLLSNKELKAAEGK